VHVQGCNTCWERVGTHSVLFSCCWNSCLIHVSPTSSYIILHYPTLSCIILLVLLRIPTLQNPSSTDKNSFHCRKTRGTLKIFGSSIFTPRQLDSNDEQCDKPAFLRYNNLCWFDFCSIVTMDILHSKIIWV